MFCFTFVFLNDFTLVEQVGYNITGWLEKNKDPLNDTVVDQFKKGQNKLLVEIFADHPGQSGGADAGGGGKGTYQQLETTNWNKFTFYVNLIEIQKSSSKSETKKITRYHELNEYFCEHISLHITLQKRILDIRTSKSNSHRYFNDLRITHIFIS